MIFYFGPSGVYCIKFSTLFFNLQRAYPIRSPHRRSQGPPTTPGSPPANLYGHPWRHASIIVDPTLEFRPKPIKSAIPPNSATQKTMKKFIFSTKKLFPRLFHAKPPPERRAGSPISKIKFWPPGPIFAPRRTARFRLPIRPGSGHRPPGSPKPSPGTPWGTPRPPPAHPAHPPPAYKGGSNSHYRNFLHPHRSLTWAIGWT